MHDLTTRQIEILKALIEEYIETASAVGSETLEKKHNLSASPATIRNEMADLEEMGLIMQPHTSAGRIPSDQGYRVYVDAMLKDKEQEVDHMKEILLDKEEKLEDLLKQIARQLAVNTNYATMISVPQIQRNKLKFIQVSRVDEQHLLATIVIEGNVINETANIIGIIQA